MASRTRLPLILSGIVAAAVFVVAALVVFRPVAVRIRVAEKAPLSASLTVRAQRPVRLRVSIVGLNDDDLVIERRERARRHEIALAGLYPDHPNEIVIEAEAADGSVREIRRTVRTEALPDTYPEVIVTRHLPGQIAPGLTFMILGHYDDDRDFVALPSAVDSYGNFRWVYDGDVGHALRRLPNGNLLIADEDDPLEIDLLGEPTGRRWSVPRGFHHDAVMLPDGNLLALSSAPESFDDGLVEIDGSTGEIVSEWDYRKILDPDRPRQPINLEPIDWLHLNAVEYDHHHDAIIVSGRDQSAVVRTDRTTGRLEWILGSHDHWTVDFQPFLLEPTGEPFEWQWGQHAPMVHPVVPNRILVYDNGNKRSYDAPLAAADYLPNGNRLVSFGGITRTLDGGPTELFDYEEGAVRPMKISARIVEVTGDQPAREVLTFSFADADPESYRGYRVYRAMRMPLNLE